VSFSFVWNRAWCQHPLHQHSSLPHILLLYPKLLGFNREYSYPVAVCLFSFLYIQFRLYLQFDKSLSTHCVIFKGSLGLVAYKVHKIDCLTHQWGNETTIRFMLKYDFSSLFMNVYLIQVFCNFRHWRMRRCRTKRLWSKSQVYQHRRIVCLSLSRRIWGWRKILHRCLSLFFLPLVLYLYNTL